MKTLYFECNMGAAGDMISASLLELLEDPKKALEELNAIGLKNVRFEAHTESKCGIYGTHMHVYVNEEEEKAEDYHDHEHSPDHEHCHDHEHSHDHEHCHGHEHHHDHEHTHDHHHHHSSLADIEEIIEGLQVSDWVKKNAVAIYEEIAKAEAHAHQQHMHDIHFHEVGTMDAIADVVASCFLIEKISPDKILSSPVCTGYGSVWCAHGILPVPAPATAYILKDVPIYSGDIEGEMCTPTGAAILKHFVSSFERMPALKVKKIGYGMGSKDFKKANCIRAFLAEQNDELGEVCVLSCNVDDMTGEEIGYACEKLLDLGAREVFSQSVMMKKFRPGVLITLICDENQADDMAAAVFKYTSTIGIRRQTVSRYTLKREMEVVKSSYGDIVKKVSKGYGAYQEKLEYEDLKEVADSLGVSLYEARNLIEKDTK